MLISFSQALCAGHILTACPIDYILPTAFLKGLYKELQRRANTPLPGISFLIYIFFIEKSMHNEGMLLANVQKADKYVTASENNLSTSESTLHYH